jgi:hypothetical protein
LRQLMACQSNDPCGSVPVTLMTLLQSISSKCRRAKSVSRRETSRTSAHVRVGVSYPYPPHYRVAFASSDLLDPHPYRLTLRRAFPEGDVRGFHVPLRECVGLGACCRPGGVWSTIPHVRDGMPPSIAFWLKPDNLFGLFPVTTFIADSHVCTIPTL